MNWGGSEADIILAKRRSRSKQKCRHAQVVLPFSHALVGKDGLQLRICGHNLSHNIVHYYYFGNLACLHVVQDRLQAQSTSRMAFCQEREDDENMTCMRMAIVGDWNEDKGDQQNFPSRKGGTKLIWFESPSWRSKTTQVRVHLGV